jgi:hypothetical protein
MVMREILRRRRMNRRQFLNRGLWAGILGLFTGAVFGLPGQSQKGGSKPEALSPREARFYSKLAG